MVELLLAAVGGAALLGGALWTGRGRLLGRAVPRVARELEARTGGRVTPGELAVLEGLDVVATGWELERDGVRVEVARAEIRQVARVVGSRGALPPELARGEARVLVGDAAPVELRFEAPEARGDGVVLLGGHVEVREGAWPLPGNPIGAAAGHLEVDASGAGSFRGEARVGASRVEVDLGWDAGGEIGTGEIRAALATADLAPWVPAGVALLEDGAPAEELTLEGEIAGTLAEPRWTLRGARPPEVDLSALAGGEEVRLQVERAEGSGGRAPEGFLLGGLLRAPGPAGTRANLPLRVRGTTPDAPLDLEVRDGFLQASTPGPPPLSGVDLDARLEVSRAGAVQLTGEVRAGTSTLEIDLHRDPEGRLDGSKVEGSLEAALLTPWIPDPGPGFGLPEEETLRVGANAWGIPGAATLALRAYAPRVRVPGGECAHVEVEVHGDPTRITLGGLSGQVLGGRFALTGEIIPGEVLAGAGKLRLDGLRVEEIPTDPAGTRGVAPHLGGALSGVFALEGEGASWCAEGEATLEEAALPFLDLAREALQAQGLRPLPTRASGPATGTLRFRDGVLEVEDLSLAAGPLEARGDLAFGGDPGAIADLTLWVEAGYLGGARALEGWDIDGEPTFVVRAGADPAWSVELGEALRARAPGRALKLRSAAVLPGEDGGAILADARGSLAVPSPWGVLTLPFVFAAEGAPPEGLALAGSLDIGGARARATKTLPSLDYQGRLEVGTDGRVATEGVLFTASSRLDGKVRLDGEGELKGTRLEGYLDPADLRVLLPARFPFALDIPEAIDLEVKVAGSLAAPRCDLRVGLESLRLGGDSPRATELRDLALDATATPDALQVRRLEAGLGVGKVTLAGKLDLAEDPVAYEGEVEVRKLLLDQLPTDSRGTRGLRHLIRGSLFGDARFRGRGRDLAALVAEGDVELRVPQYIFLRDAGENAGLGALPIKGKGPATAHFSLRDERVSVVDLRIAVDRLRAAGDIEVGLHRDLAGRLVAEVEPSLLAKSPLLSIPAAALGTVRVPIDLGGTAEEPVVNADFAGVIGGLMGRTVTGRVMKGAADSLWSTFAREGVKPGRDTDAILETILAGGPEGEATLERLMDTGISHEEVEELLDDYYSRRG